MARSEILIHDVATGRPAPLPGATAPTASSAGLRWSGLALEQQLVPASETGDGFLPWHLLAVLINPPQRFEDHHGRTVRRWRPAPGDVVFRPAGVPSRAAWTSSSESINVVVDPAYVGGSARLEASRFGRDPVVRHLALALCAHIAAARTQGLFADGIRDALAAHLGRRYATTPGPATGVPGRLTAAELDRVRERVETSLDEPLRVADLAAAVPLSPAHFSRTFRATVGMTPHAYVMRRRVLAVRRLLETTTLDLETVARRTGFADRSHLSRHVRRTYGLAPADLRRLARR